MYAIVKSGGKQFRADVEKVLIVDKLAGEPGTEVELGEVLMLVEDAKTTVGTPYVTGAKVRGQIVRQTKGAKVRAFNYKPKKNERKRWGHREQLTHVKITAIEVAS